MNTVLFKSNFINLPISSLILTCFDSLVILKSKVVGKTGVHCTALLFAVCTNKLKMTYKSILEKLKVNQPKFDPKKVNCYFELAAINAVKEARVQFPLQAECYSLFEYDWTEEVL